MCFVRMKAREGEFKFSLDYFCWLLIEAVEFIAGKSNKFHLCLFSFSLFQSVENFPIRFRFKPVVLLAKQYSCLFLMFLFHLKMTYTNHGFKVGILSRQFHVGANEADFGRTSYSGRFLNHLPLTRAA